MEVPHSPLTSLLVGLLVGYLIGYLNHGLAERREARTRLRRFRDDINALATRFDPVEGRRLFREYIATVRQVTEACARICEDVSPLHRSAFRKHRDNFCRFTRSDLELASPDNPAGMDQYMAANQQHRAKMTARLQEALRALARSAR